MLLTLVLLDLLDKGAEFSRAVSHSCLSTDAELLFLLRTRREMLYTPCLYPQQQVLHRQGQLIMHVRVPHPAKVSQTLPYGVDRDPVASMDGGDHAVPARFGQAAVHEMMGFPRKPAKASNATSSNSLLCRLNDTRWGSTCLEASRSDCGRAWFSALPA